MNKIKLLTVAGSLVIASSLLAPTVANAVIYTSATSCMAANLNQALQGMGWSQAGVKNNSTSSFFVVCPLSHDSISGVSSSVAVVATFPGNTGDIECTVRGQSISGGTYTTASLIITSGTGSVGTNRGATEVSFPFNSTDLNNTVVCALDPGEGIELAVIG